MWSIAMSSNDAAFGIIRKDFNAFNWHQFVCIFCIKSLYWHKADKSGIFEGEIKDGHYLTYLRQVNQLSISVQFELSKITRSEIIQIIIRATMKDLTKKLIAIFIGTIILAGIIIIVWLHQKKQLEEKRKRRSALKIKQNRSIRTLTT